jgi:hypothetical protein
MKPAKEKYYRGLFTIAALYDLLLGVTFSFFAAPAFAALGIGDKLPAFGGYVTLLGAFVLVIGFDPRRHALQVGLRGDGILLLGGGWPAARRLRRAVRRSRHDLLRPDGGMLAVPDARGQKLN